MFDIIDTTPTLTIILNYIIFSTTIKKNQCRRVRMNVVSLFSDFNTLTMINKIYYDLAF